MLIDSPLTNRIALGAGRIVPEIGDAQFQLPPIGLLTIPLIQETNIPAAVIVQDKSFIATNTFARGAAAGITSATFAQLGRGLWDLTFTFMARTNATFTLAAADFATNLSILAGGSSLSLLVVPMQVNLAYTETIKLQLLLPFAQADLIHSVSGTGATGTLDSVVSLIANRVL